jgi:hypothetical protein
MSKTREGFSYDIRARQYCFGFGFGFENPLMTTDTRCSIKAPTKKMLNAKTHKILAANDISSISRCFQDLMSLSSTIRFLKSIFLFVQETRNISQLMGKG